MATTSQLHVAIRMGLRQSENLGPFRKKDQAYSGIAGMGRGFPNWGYDSNTDLILLTCVRNHSLPNVLRIFYVAAVKKVW